MPFLHPGAPQQRRYGNHPTLINEREPLLYGVLNVGAICAYLVFYFLFRDFLPEKWVLDSGKIVDLIATDSFDSLGDSYAVTASIFQLIGLENLHLFTAATSAAFLWVAVRHVRHAKDLAIRWLLLSPCVMLNMLAPSKDTVVLLISMLLTLSALVFGRNLRPTILLFLGLYVLYGIFIRKYYLLVVGAWTVLYFVLPRPRRYTWIAAIVAVLITLAMPEGIAELLQSSRDTSNSYANIVGSDNRTAFTNLVAPTNGLSFLVNYGYAASVLVFPFFYFGTLADIAAQLFVFVVLGTIFTVHRAARRSSASHPSTFFAALVAAHLLVQFIFEPDVGSFVRHLSSIVIYIVAIRWGTDFRATK